MHHTISDRDHLASLVQTSDDAIMTKSLDGTVLTWNPAATRIFGYLPEEMVGQKMMRLFPPDRVHEEDEILARLARGERVQHFRTQRLHKDGRTIDISVTISPICDAAGRVVAASKIARDITAQVQAEQQIAQYKALIDSSDDAIISKDCRGIIRTWNAGATRIFGYTREEAVGRHARMLFPPERLGEEERLIEAVLQGQPVRHFRTTRLTKDGRRIFASVSLSAIRSEAGEIIGFSKILRDLTQDIQQEQLLWKEVHYDSLTGLMSRIGIQNAVDDLIRISQVRKRAIAVVHCNIDDFSQVNARFSSEVGNQLLVRIAQALRGVVREADDMARVHADNFVVLLHGFLCNRGFWLPWMRLLRARGHAYVAPTLEPAFGSIDDYAAAIDAAVRRVAAATGMPPVIIGHSMGGLAARAWLRAYGGKRDEKTGAAGAGAAERRVHRIITLGSPHGGAWSAFFTRAHNGAQMRIGNRWLAALRQHEPAGRAALFTCWYSNCDSVVFPASTATLPGADNRLVPGVAHLQMAFHAPLVQACLEELEELAA